jgi:hypothetical protein
MRKNSSGAASICRTGPAPVYQCFHATPRVTMSSSARQVTGQRQRRCRAADDGSAGPDFRPPNQVRQRQAALEFA